MKKKAQDQAALLRAARRTLKLTNGELAAALGKSAPALLAWLAPKGAAKHRKMPDGSRLLLAHLVAAKRKSR